MDGLSTDADGFFVLGNPQVANVDYIFPNNTLQNGADAVALYVGDPDDFPLVTTTDLIDALVYDTGDPDDPGLLVLLEPGQPQVDEDAGGNRLFDSMARVPDGGPAPPDTALRRPRSPSPGERNSPVVVPDGDFDDDGDLDCADVDALTARDRRWDERAQSLI